MQAVFHFADFETRISRIGELWMKKQIAMKSVFVFLLVCGCNGLFAQQKLQTVERVVLNDTKSPIIWIDSMKTDINHLLVERASFDSLTILKDSVTIKKRYGVDTREVLVMYPKKGGEGDAPA